MAVFNGWSSVITRSASDCSSTDSSWYLRLLTLSLASGEEMVAWIAGVRSRRRFNMSTVLFHLVGVSVRRFRSCFFHLAGREPSDSL